MTNRCLVAPASQHDAERLASPWTGARATREWAAQICRGGRRACRRHWVPSVTQGGAPSLPHRPAIKPANCNAAFGDYAQDVSSNGQWLQTNWWTCSIGYWRRRWHWHLHLQLPRRGRQPVCSCRAPGPGQLRRLRWAMPCRANNLHPQQVILLRAALFAATATVASHRPPQLPHAGHSSSCVFTTNSCLNRH